jgi:hypothetical protein
VDPAREIDFAVRLAHVDAHIAVTAAGAGVRLSADELRESRSRPELGSQSVRSIPALGAGVITFKKDPSRGDSTLARAVPIEAPQRFRSEILIQASGLKARKSIAFRNP